MSNKLGNVKERLVNTLDLPADIALNLPKITIIAKKEITVENHKGIMRFSTNELVINTTEGALTIKGDNLEIAFVGGTTISLKGNFKGVVYDNYEEV